MTKDSFRHSNSKGQRTKDIDNYCNESSSFTNLRCRRGSPAAYWEPPPPPPTLPFSVGGYDLHPWYGGGYHSSREDLRMLDYYKRHEFCRYGSASTLPISSSQEFFGNGGNSICCGNRYPQYCPCIHKNSSTWNLSQVNRQNMIYEILRFEVESECLLEMIHN